MLIMLCAAQYSNLCVRKAFNRRFWTFSCFIPVVEYNGDNYRNHERDGAMDGNRATTLSVWKRAREAYQGDRHLVLRHGRVCT